MSNYTSTILIITGPTAIGKTRLALELAKKFNGELISADSRQVYKYMDIGTGKDLPVNTKFNPPTGGQNLKLPGKSQKLRCGFYNINNIRVWGLDIVKPNYWFNVSDWVSYANMVISDIKKRDKLPIIVGGTGQYIRSLIEPPQTLNIPIDLKLRKSLEHCSVAVLKQKLMEFSLHKWLQMNDSDRHNPRRLIRAVEVALGKQKSIRQPADKTQKLDSKAQKLKYLAIGLEADRESINSGIDSRVDKRVRDGILEEIKLLLDKGYSWDLPSMSGSGYREFKQYFQSGKIYKLDTAIQRWKIDEHQYAKRQLTYLKKYLPDCFWFDVSASNWQSQVEKLVQKMV